MQSLIKIPLQTHKDMGPQTCQLYDEIYTRGQCLSPFFPQFLTDSYELSQVYLIWHDKLIYGR